MRSGVVFLVLVAAVVLASLSASGAEPGSRSPALARVAIGIGAVDWLPDVEAKAFQLTVAGPGTFYWTRTFPTGTRPRFAVSDIGGHDVDGLYTYELKALPEAQPQPRRDGVATSQTPSRPPLTQSGAFTLRGGSFVRPSLAESPMRALYTYNEDLYVVGSLCVGTDCSDPETWGYDVLRLKENNLRINFTDTSSTSSYPANDWSIVINDTDDGGSSFFAIQDATSGNTVFKIEAGAPANSLYVKSYGRVGLKTSTPAVDLHIVEGASPTVRLEQDTSYGSSAQVWDVVSNEINFFVRDVTHDSKIPFRIQPGAPSSSLCLKSDGKVGIGTWTPDYKVDVQTTGENSALVVTRTDGASNYINATATYANFGSVNNFPTRIMVNGTWRARFNPDNSLDMVNGASCTAGGVWTNASSIALKENVVPLSPEVAQTALLDLQPVLFNYKVDPGERHVGFIAEQVPELVATKDRTSLSPMDIVAVLTRVVQEQQRTIEELTRRLEKVERAAHD